MSIRAYDISYRHESDRTCLFMSMLTKHVLLYSYWAFVYSGGWDSVAKGVSSVTVHGVGCLFIWIDFLLSAERFYYKATFWAVLFGTLFAIWSLIFTAAELTNEDGKPYIYSSFDWTSGAAKPVGYYFASVAILIIISVFAAFIKNIILIRSDIHTTKIRVRNEEKNGASGSGGAAGDVEMGNDENGGTNTQSAYPKI